MAKAEGAVVEEEYGGPRSLTRLLGLLDALAKSPDGLTLTDLSVALECPKSSLLNLLRPLVREVYLTHDGIRYRLGPAIFRLAGTIMSVWNFSKVLRPYLEELAARCHETAYMGVLDRDRGVFVISDVIESAKSIKFGVPIGSTAPLYCTAVGRVLLAHADKSWQAEYLRAVKLERLSPLTIPTKKALRDELDKVLRHGYSVAIGETSPESGGIAAPIFGSDGRVIAAIGAGAPLERFRKLAMLRKALLDVAARASGMSQRQCKRMADRVGSRSS